MKQNKKKKTKQHKTQNEDELFLRSRLAVKTNRWNQDAEDDEEYEDDAEPTRNCSQVETRREEEEEEEES